MENKMPTSRLSRTVSTGKVAAKMGGNQLRYLVKRPFLSSEKNKKSRGKRDEKNAKALFQGLSLLRGTALKAAQMLSFEHEVLPDSFQQELEKSYHQVPPINRALVRKILINNLGEPPEKLFKQFEPLAFAAASLGQVHRALSLDGKSLAVKVQYPDMAKTIDNDIRLINTLARPMADYPLIKTALDEIRGVLLAETDYEKEAANIRFFHGNLNLPGVKVPKTVPDLSTGQILTMSLLEGQVLSEWLKTDPDQDSRNQVAQTLNDIFIKGLYELNLIHADPNPGNFLVMENLDIGLLDYGCVRAVGQDFVTLYRELIRLGGTRDFTGYQELLARMKFIPRDMDPVVRDQMITGFMDMGDWFSQMFSTPYFDFGANPDLMAQGRQIGTKMQKFRGHIQGFMPEFVFLDRTRYGLIRLYEQMKVRIRIQNPYETSDSI